MEKVFLWIEIVLAVFSTLLLSNFISLSISNKKKEIGILRAVGARGSDVFKIFIAESLTISIICSILALVGTAFVCYALNSSVLEQFGFAIIPLFSIIFSGFTSNFYNWNTYCNICYIVTCFENST